MRVNTARADCQTMPKMARVISRPMIGSASGKPSQTPMRAEHHGQAGQPVGAGVVAVRDQRRAVDLPADPDAEHGDRLVAEEADDAGGGDPAELRDRLRMDQPVDRLVAGDERAEQDDQHDQRRRRGPRPARAVGEGPVGLRRASTKAIQSGIGRRGVADIVDGVGKQRDAARDERPRPSASRQ